MGTQEETQRMLDAVDLAYRQLERHGLHKDIAVVWSQNRAELLDREGNVLVSYPVNQDNDDHCDYESACMSCSIYAVSTMHSFLTKL